MPEPLPSPPPLDPARRQHPAALRWGRRAALLGLAVSLSGCAWLRTLWPFGGGSGLGPAPTARAGFSGPPPILFVHGNGDSGALWQTTVWRFESNGWPRERLFAVDLPYPLARDDDRLPQEGRSSTTEQRQALAAEIDRVLRTTGAPRLVLIANSRGGNAVRSYLAEGGSAAAARVSHAVLGGTPNHGVQVDLGSRLGNEFNGAGPFLTALNRPKGPNGDEVTPGVGWMTVRSDNNDKFAQPTGEWIGARGKPTNVSYDGPALKGAHNVVIPGIDHRETSYGPKAFAEAYRFLTGQPAPVGSITPEASVQLGGKVFGLGLADRPGSGSFVNNLPLVGAQLEVHAVNPANGERVGAPLWRQTIGADGRWGPVSTTPATPLEFVVAAPGYATVHTYRSPFPRSSNLVHLQAGRIAETDRDGLAVVSLTRPRGYFGVPRDEVELDGLNPAPGIPPGVAGVASSKRVLREPPGRAVAGSFNGERIVGRTWPAVDNHLTVLELTY
jgi:pimeloyl-ACP methyl ester carboxylesterase